MEDIITWVHISDLHMNPNGSALIRLEEIAHDIQAQRTRRGICKIDFVAVTGDLAWTGKGNEYKLVKDGFDKLISEVGILKNMLFLVPGNHDVDRDIVKAMNIEPPGKDNDAVSAALMDRKTEVLASQSGYINFIKSYFNLCLIAYDKIPDGLLSISNFAIGKHQVSVNCMNTAWLCRGKDDRGSLAIGEPQLSAIKSNISGDIVISLMHHPFAWLRDHESTHIHREIARLSSFILTGHMHNPRFESSPCGDRAFILSAGAIKSEKAISYNIVQLLPSAKEGNVHIRIKNTYLPDWFDFNMTPDIMNDGTLKLKQEGDAWLPDLRPQKKLLGATNHSPKYEYSRIFRIANLNIQYIILINSLVKGENEYRFGDIKITTSQKEYSLPVDFDLTPFKDFGEEKCRFVKFSTNIGPARFPNELHFTFSRVRYVDYLASGEHLDDHIPNMNSLTFREKYAPAISSSHNFENIPLTNICGVGVFLITTDNKIIISKHSPNVSVYSDHFGYAASGTMDWNIYPHPFEEIIRECQEEINHSMNVDNTHLFSLGIDAKKLFFQFSFFERTSKTSEEIIKNAVFGRDYNAEMEGIYAVPFTIEAVFDKIKNENWEPAASAGLLTLCAKEFGIDKLKRAIDYDFVDQEWKNEMKETWRLRASRPDDLPVMSARYSYTQCHGESVKYVDNVIKFMEEDIVGKDVLEIGSGIGRISDKLLMVVNKLICVEQSKEMMELSRIRLKYHKKQPIYINNFIQDCSINELQSDVALTSLVLMHNIDDVSFKKTIQVLSVSAEIIFVFEHIDEDSIVSSHTKIRGEKDLFALFYEYGFKDIKKQYYDLFNDKIVFAKFIKRID